MMPNETADFTIQVEATISMDVVSIMGSKMGVITNVQ